jgi:hypothetical protein
VLVSVRLVPDRAGADDRAHRAAPAGIAWIRPVSESCAS